MAIVFPANPSVGDTFDTAAARYMWNGTSWRAIGVDPTIYIYSKTEIDSMFDDLISQVETIAGV